MRGDDVTPRHGWYFTAPWESVSVRRGDALGLRAAADEFAERLAPGLNNGASDARWISILSWCLQWSHSVWTRAGGGDLSRREEQRARYAWLRPLELMWVARTLASGQTTGQLRGRRSIERWSRSDRRLPDFAMSADQLRRYRQVGTYGAYRVVFRTMPGLTLGDGWTPGPIAHALANVVDASLPRQARLSVSRFEERTKWGHWAQGNQNDFWMKHGWPEFVDVLGGLLPTPDDAMNLRLPARECEILAPLIFDRASTRLATAEALASATHARSHAELCDALAAAPALAAKLPPEALAPLPAFTRFADAAMHAMRTVWARVNADAQTQSPSVTVLARAETVRDGLAEARALGLAWLQAPGRHAFAQDGVVTRLAEALRDAPDTPARVRALVLHHQHYGGGRRWLREADGALVPLVRDSDVAASDYRFRLRSLARLAAQCGLANMSVALDAISATDDDDNDDERAQ